MLNKLNTTRSGFIFFLWDEYTLFSSYLHYEFDKNANSFYVSVKKPFCVKFVERQIGVCVFLRGFGHALFLKKKQQRL